MAKGGVSNFNLKTMGRGMAKVAAQKGALKGMKIGAKAGMKAGAKTGFLFGKKAPPFVKKGKGK